MASTGVNEGKITGIYDGTTLISYATGSEWNVTMDTREITSKDSGAGKEFRPVRYSFEASGEFLFAEDATHGYEELYDKMVAGTAVTVKLSSGVTGDVEYSGSAYITSMNRSAPDGDNETFSATLQGTGTITKATI